MSLKDSNDSIEKLYGSKVLKYFPNYEVFWLRFIGNPNSEGIEPYEYNFPTNIGVEEKKKILKAYEKIQITHYSLFCHFSGAHFQLEELKHVKNIKSLERRYFRHWEHFEVGYFHLGSVFYLWDTLCNILINLKSGNLQFDPTLNERFKAIRKNVKLIRDLFVHSGRKITNYPHRGRFYIPLKIDQNMMWSQQIVVKERIEAVKKLEHDITEVEKIINELHVCIANEYANFINRKNIQIEYGEENEN